jgi:hypothetical protein
MSPGWGCGGAGGGVGGVGTAGAGWGTGVGWVGSWAEAGGTGGGDDAAEDAGAGPAAPAGWAASPAGTGAGAGGKSSGAAAAGLGSSVPGGAASITGAPHCSQNSPLRSNALLQNRQITAPGWRRGLSNAFLKASSSTSPTSFPRLGRGCSGGGPGRGVSTGEGEILRETVDCGVGCAGRPPAVEGAGATGDGWLRCRPGAAMSGGPAGRAGGALPAGPAAEAGGWGEATAAIGAPHWRQKRMPSGRSALHSVQVAIHFALE